VATKGNDSALILVDLQNDFLPGGALAVPRGDEVLPVASALLPRFEIVVATQDWHPENHASFAANHPGKKVGERIDLHGLPQILWPVHCVQNTRGAAFADGLDLSRAHIFQKGTDPAIDSYSGFFDNGHRKSTGLSDFLKARAVKHVFVMGLATDYCVKATALDARAEGFAVTLILNGCRGVELKPGDCARAADAMRTAGVEIIESGEVGEWEQQL
jgi:nicotinamidase/pyrazinamidase